MLKGNRGEWSEIYTFLTLLSEGKLLTAHQEQSTSDGTGFDVLRIEREEMPGEKIEYHVIGDLVSVESKDEIITTEPRDSFRKQAGIVYAAISRADSSGPFSVPDAERFLSEVKVQKLKAPSKNKSDITVKVRDPYSGATPLFGWSIKSELGSSPTLLNAGKTTNFTFSISGMTKKDAKDLNAIATRSKIKDRVCECCRSFGVQFKCVDSYVFSRNMRLIDTMFPQIMAKALLYYYQGAATTCADVVALLEKKDPLSLGSGMYEYKFKKFLVATALGMVPANPWDGIDDATGGYIVVGEDGGLLCYNLYNRNTFEDYLLCSTRFETASSTRHEFGAIERQQSGYEIKLNLQIRFI